ncbi:hypothetical protein CMK18_20785 [Candidatus Poribacteria bacterium]|nr:hypothetical protein [Candidatus Poribacteria bacterium]
MTSVIFNTVKDQVRQIGVDWHSEEIISNSIKNRSSVEKSIADIKEDRKSEQGIVISAGPSLHYSDTLDVLAQSDFCGIKIAVDGSYLKCLKVGIIPDFILTLDPHPTRPLRWFGDPGLKEKDLLTDDYYRRQDLDIDFRQNSLEQNYEHISLVNEYARQSKMIISATVCNVLTKRLENAGFDLYWWIPLVDNPDEYNSLTRRMFDITGVQAFNTGGNVGTAAWVFAKFWLGIQDVAVIGMDLGYKAEMPYEMTQTYPELQELLGQKRLSSELFPEMKNPLTSEVFYTDPTYYWYRENLLELIKNSSTTLYNCTQGGVLFGEGIKNIYLKDFIERNYHG